MRHNLLKNWNLLEASGIYNRDPGQKFAKNNHEISFVEVRSFPELGKYESSEELENAVGQVQEELGDTPIQWTNREIGNKAFGLAYFTDENGNAVVFGRFFRQIDRVMTGRWANTDMLGWNLQTGAAKKMQTGLDPQSLIKTEAVFTSSQEVIDKVVANGLVDPVMVNGLTAVATGQPLPIIFEGSYSNMAAIRDYFGEIMQPLALQSGLIGGEADGAKVLINNQPWSACNIKWPMDPTHNLVDSYMISPEGIEIGISSKGGAGAKASAKNLHDAIQNAVDRGDNDFLASVQYARDVVTIIAENSQYQGPLKLAMALKMINIEDADYVLKLIKAQVNRPRNLSQNLIKWWNKGKSTKGNAIDKTQPNYTAGRHLLANIAQVVCDKINAKAKFGDQALKLMNQSSIIQVYTNVGKAGDDLKLTGFKSIYPPNFKGKIVLASDKQYNATRTGGKLSFTFKKI